LGFFCVVLFSNNASLACNYFKTRSVSDLFSANLFILGHFATSVLEV